MKYLVTGGAGFIGSHITAALLKDGHSVRVLDNLSTGKRENLKDYLPHIEFTEGDIRSYHTVFRAVRGTDIILHQAALPSIPRSIYDPITTNEVNITGTLNLLEAAKENSVKRLVFASSSSVYGNNTELPKTENMPPNPLSPYAVTKLTGEKYCSVFNKIYGLETVILRYFNVFGPGQDPNSQYSAVIPKFIRLISRGIPPEIFGDGTQSRDFTFVSNVVNANILASQSEAADGLVFNCACGGSITLNDLAAQLNSILGTSVKPVYRSPRPADIKHSFASVNLAYEKLGYIPKISFSEGLKITAASYVEKTLPVIAEIV